MPPFRLVCAGAGALTLIACGSASATDEIVVNETVRLEWLWTLPGFDEPESATLGPDGTFFITNVGGEHDARNGKGYVSQVDTQGVVLKLRWAEGLDAPKGIAVLDDVLYVADIDRVVMFDVSDATPRGEVPVEGAGYLNDLAVWRGGIYVSDTQHGTIHQITPEGAELFASSANWGGINGLQQDDDALLIVTMEEGHLIEYRGEGRERIIASGMTNADGVGRIPNGGYIVSSWPGQIYYVCRAGQVTLLLDTQADGIFQNDLNIYNDILIVPNMVPGTVTAWQVMTD